ncbi:MAG: hypothetical protein WD898_03445 [Candidatus Paceibacterota bacterium]
MPVLLFFVALESWLIYIRDKYFLSIKWVLLEIKPPPDVQKSPKIAENIFAGLHSAYITPIDWKKRFFKGEVQPWFSFEIVGNGGEMNFYIRTPDGFKDVIESLIFAQYPDAEINVADDYINALPKYIPNDEYDLFGTELIFTKDDAYPIKTYPFFEEESGKDEFKRTDPLAPLAEILSALEPGEHVWLQLTARATGDGWVKEAQKAVDKLTGKEPKIERDAFGKAIDFIDDLIPGASAPKSEEKKKEFEFMKLTPGQRFVLEQVENKVAKLGFKCGYRFLYAARKEVMKRSRTASVIGMFKQVYSNNLNSFRPNMSTLTIGKGWFSKLFPSGAGFGAKQEEYRKKYNLYRDYRDRSFVKKVIILNTEELATLFHLPGIGVKAPSFPRVEAKKGQPPAGLPM